MIVKCIIELKCLLKLITQDFFILAYGISYRTGIGLIKKILSVRTFENFSFFFSFREYNRMPTCSLLQRNIWT